MSRETVIFGAVFILVEFLAQGNGLEFLPPPLMKCHVRDEKCWMEQSQIYLKTFKNGIPERNIKPFEPMVIGDFDIKGDNNAPTSLNLAVINLRMFNLTSIKVTNVKILSADPKKHMKLQLTMYIPASTLKFDYKINGKILILPIRGDGYANLNIFNTTVKINSIIHFENREDGKDYVKDIDVRIVSRTEDANIYLSNLFNGDKALSENVLKVMNENWRLLSPDFDPRIYDALGKQVAHTVKTMLKDVPYEEVFLQE